MLKICIVEVPGYRIYTVSGWGVPALVLEPAACPIYSYCPVINEPKARIAGKKRLDLTCTHRCLPPATNPVGILYPLRFR